MHPTGRITGRDHEWVQDTLTVAVAIFWQMGLDTKLDKTKAMVCTHIFIWGKWGELAYTRQATGEGANFRERKKARVSCAMCNVTMAESYLKAHMARSHGICVTQIRGVNEVGGGTTKNVVYFPKAIKELRCTVPGCTSVAHSAGRLCEHFMFRHFRSKVALDQEGKKPLP